MGKVRECFRCSTLLTLMERRVVESTDAAGVITLVEVCSECHVKILNTKALLVGQAKGRHVLRPRPEQNQLFPTASRKVAGKGGRRG